MKAARRASVAGGDKNAAATTKDCKVPDFEPLTDDEVVFCWRGIADQGQLAVPKLQKFMLDICGEKLSIVQAKDLLNYMDADGDGRVGMQDFRNFMSIGRLADTDPKNYMWTPKAKYREEHGLTAANYREEDGVVKDAGLQATASLFAVNKHENQRLSIDSDSADQTMFMTPKTSMTPHVPAGKKKGPTRQTHAAIHAAAAGADEELVSDPAAAAKDEAPKEKKERVPVDPKTIARIEEALSKYEAASWTKFLKEEEDFKRKLFVQFAQADPNELSITEYHKMLMKWHKLAKWCLPGDMRPADSLAAMEYVLRRDGEAQEKAAPPAEGEAAPPAGSPAPTMNTEAKLSYRLWIDLLNGKYRPEEHITAPKH